MSPACRQYAPFILLLVGRLCPAFSMTPMQSTPTPGSWHAFQAEHIVRNGKYGNAIDSYTSRFLLVPERKLLFCGIDRNFYENFTSLFEAIRHSDGKAGRRMHGNSPASLGYSKKDIELILKDKSWHKAVFLREPLDRFLSQVFKDASNNDTSVSPTRFAPVVVKTLRTFADASRHRNHLKWQANYCGGLATTLPYYDTVELASPVTIHQLVKDLLDRVGVKWNPGFNEFFPPLAKQAHMGHQKNFTPYLAMLLQGNATVEDLLPFYPEAKSWHADSGSGSNPDNANWSWVISVLLKLFKQDYETLGMDVPAWAVQVTENVKLMRQTTPGNLGKQRSSTASVRPAEITHLPQHKRALPEETASLKFAPPRSKEYAVDDGIEEEIFHVLHDRERDAVAAAADELEAPPAMDHAAEETLSKTRPKAKAKESPMAVRAKKAPKARATKPSELKGAKSGEGANEIQDDTADQLAASKGKAKTARTQEDAVDQLAANRRKKKNARAQEDTGDQHAARSVKKRKAHAEAKKRMRPSTEASKVSPEERFARKKHRAMASKRIFESDQMVPALDVLAGDAAQAAYYAERGA